MMDPETAFVAGMTVASIGMLIFMPLMIFKPRFESLMQDRNEWKLRAELAENEIGRAEALDFDVLGSWGSATDPADWLDT